MLITGDENQMNKIVIKKSKKQEQWQDEKIVRGLKKSASRSLVKLSDHEINQILDRVKSQILDKTITTTEIYSLVTHELGKVNTNALQEYLSFNKYKDQYAKSFQRVTEFSTNMIYSGDKENANKDTALNSTKQAVISEEIMKEMMVSFELEPEWVEAHENGWIHIHDQGSRFLNGINCCLFDMANLLKGGFVINGVKYKEPNSIQSALNVVGDVTLSASGNQYGGFTIPEIDTILAPYAEKSYQKWRDYYTQQLGANIEQDQINMLAMDRVLREINKGYIGFETKLNTISNSLGQVPFVTISLGLDTNYWARVIAKEILKVRREGIGENKTTAIFPKIIFLSRKEINRNNDSPNYDLYELAIDTSKRRMYPDYLSLDNAEIGNNLAEVYERSGKVVSPMGCRAFLAPFYHPKTGEEIYTGRSNLGAISLNLPKMAIESGGDLKLFYQFIDYYTSMVWAIHQWTFSKIAKSKGSTNPLLFCEGGSWMSVGYDEEIRPIIEASTMSLGYVGLEEVSHYLFGESIKNNEAFGLQLVKYLKKSVDEADEKYDFIAALYSTPAESLVYRFQKMNRQQYGNIENVTNKEYMTNSFHIHVTEDISPIEKTYYEAPYHRIATGGRISFAEYPYGIANNVLKQCVDYAMDLGLYYGVNIVSSSCPNCEYQGDFLEECPQCLNQDITTVTRACGYLSFSKIKGDTRYNLGKQAEIRERVKHIKTTK